MVLTEEVVRTFRDIVRGELSRGKAETLEAIAMAEACTPGTPAEPDTTASEGSVHSMARVSATKVATWVDLAEVDDAVQRAVSAVTALLQRRLGDHVVEAMAMAPLSAGGAAYGMVVTLIGRPARR